MKFNCSYSELVEIHKLQPNPKNPNHHPQDQIERLAKIIDYQGQRSPIVVSNRSGFITKGHGRKLAIEHLGWEKVAVDYQDYESEAQEYADIVADNSIAEWSNLDFSQINNDFTDLGPELDLEMLGLRNFTIDADPTLAEINAADENAEWAEFSGSEFETADKEIKMTLVFKTEEDRQSLKDHNGWEVSSVNCGQWTVRL